MIKKSELTESYVDTNDPYFKNPIKPNFISESEAIQIAKENGRKNWDNLLIDLDIRSQLEIVTDKPRP